MCDGVPYGWFENVVKCVRWAQMLWVSPAGASFSGGEVGGRTAVGWGRVFLM